MRETCPGFVPASNLYDVRRSERIEVDWSTAPVETEGSP
jgi:hypothetical protein